MSLKMTLLNVEAEFNKIFSDRKNSRISQGSLMVSEMLDELAAATPIDTGLARASWDTERVGDLFKVKNPVDYIQKLNQGSSKQAPARFIERIALKYGDPLGTIVDIEE